MTTLIDHLPIIVLIEETSGLTWDEIVATDNREWLYLYESEVEQMNNETLNIEEL